MQTTLWPLFASRFIIDHRERLKVDTAFISSASLGQEGSSVLAQDQTNVNILVMQIHSALCGAAHGTGTCEFVFRCISLRS